MEIADVGDDCKRNLVVLALNKTYQGNLLLTKYTF